MAVRLKNALSKLKITALILKTYFDVALKSSLLLILILIFFGFFFRRRF